MASISTEAKVGVFVMVGIAILAYMTVRLGKLQLGQPQGYAIWGHFDNATGLKLNAPVEMAGIRVGQVERIELDQGRAKLTMRIDGRLQLPSDSVANIRTRGVLGDKYMALDTGSPAAPPLKDGDQIVKARAPEDLEELMGRLGGIAHDVKDITASLRVSLASPESQKNIAESLANLRDVTHSLKGVLSDNQDRLNRVVTNMDKFVGDLAEVSTENKQALSQTIQNFLALSDQLGRTMGGLSSVIAKIDKGEGSLGALVNERATLDDLNATLANLRDITKKIQEGKGSIGRLINDETTVTRMDEALAGINSYLTKADAWRTYVDYRGEYLFQESGFRNTFNLILQPKPDKFYLLGIVTDPVGKRNERINISTTTTGGVTTTTTDRLVTYDRDSVKFNAQFGKRFSDFTLRAGLFSSTGGLGVDYDFWDDRLKLSLEAYDFRTDYKPHLRAALDYTFFKYFRITTGWDDFVSDEGHASFFAGVGLTFYDDDLKFLLTNAPKP